MIFSRRVSRGRALLRPWALLGAVLGCAAAEGSASDSPTDVAQAELPPAPSDAEQETAQPDVTAPDEGALPAPDVFNEDVPDVRDVSVDDVVADACCASDTDCAVGEFCAPTDKTGSAVGQCLPRTPPKDQCWYNTDCGKPGAVCGGVVFAACGEGASEPGLCDVVTPPGCCADFGGCGPGETCWQDYCIAESLLQGCLSAADCQQIGWICEGSLPADGACLLGGAPPVFGQCAPSGPGGMCVVATSAALGDCGDPLGWGWNGGACVELTGCDCAEVCDGVFPSQEDCEAACSPPSCCADDAACGQGRRCISGNCVVAVDAPACYLASDCDVGLDCAAESTCQCGDKWCSGGIIIAPFTKVVPPCKDPPCDGASSGPVAAGQCKEPPICCDAEGACEDGLVCAPHAWDLPACLPAPDAGSCWGTGDCAAGEWCVGANPCGCKEFDCLPAVGACEPIPEGCCTSDADCADDLSCTAIVGKKVAAAGGDVGECTPPPEAGMCFSDAHCESDEVCQYFNGWACGTDVTLGPPWPGDCVPKDGVCCTFDHECAEGFVCARTLQGGVCKPALELSSDCWDTSDCGEGEACTGAKACGTCAECQGPSQLGSCEDAALVCCDADTDCEPGQWCSAMTTPEPWSPPGVVYGQCVGMPTEVGKCFRIEHCQSDEVCTGYSGYPCGYPPPNPLGKTNLWPGDCSAADGACCTSDGQCPVDYRCVGQALLVGQSGVCKPMKFDGSCWTNLDCSDNEECQGGFVCGCSWCGPLPDTLGTCVVE